MDFTFYSRMICCLFIFSFLLFNLLETWWWFILVIISSPLSISLVVYLYNCNFALNKCFYLLHSELLPIPSSPGWRWMGWEWVFTALFFSEGYLFVCLYTYVNMHVLFGYEEEHDKSCYCLGFDQFKLLCFSWLVWSIILLKISSWLWFRIDG